MVFCIGLTGTIASGKTTASLFFKKHHIEVISADEYARSLVLPGEPALDEIATYFGSSILKENGELDRKQLRQLILQRPEAKQWLERCLHPRIRQAIEHHVQRVQTPYCVIEIPLLIDKTSYPYLDRVLLIEASREIQIQRLMQRDHCTKEEATLFLNNQPHQLIHRELADDRIINDGNILHLEKKLLHLHHRYLHLASLFFG